MMTVAATPHTTFFLLSIPLHKSLVLNKKGTIKSNFYGRDCHTEKSLVTLQQKYHKFSVLHKN
jgi:hypothetical protein